MPARKRFGQHFLVDYSVIEGIVSAIAPQPGERLIEIGPGRGALTAPLLARGVRLEVVEIDRDLIPGLTTDALGGEGELVVHESDVLKFDFTALGHSLRLVGNLPYNISTPLLFHLLPMREHLQDMHFMLQKEVVDRMAAAPGSKTYGRLSVMLAQWWRIEPLFDIGPEAFAPPPRVDSSVVRITVRQTPAFEVSCQLTFETVVRQAFSMRRKTLRNSLRKLADESLFEAAGVSPTLRPEQVAPADFARLATLIAAQATAADGDASR